MSTVILLSFCRPRGAGRCQQRFQGRRDGPAGRERPQLGVRDVLELLHDGAELALNREVVPDLAEAAFEELPNRARVAADGLLVERQDELLRVDLAFALELIENL
jgi:hypothetical protein